MSRKTSSKVMNAVLLAWGSQITLLFVSFIIFWIFRSRWNPVDFKLDYWMVAETPFWPTLFGLAAVPLIAAFAMGQLDWLNSKHLDDLEEETILGQGLSLKMAISLFAGVVEEVSHRGIFIYTAMISIAFTNKFFWWMAWFMIILGILLILGSKFDAKGVFAGLFLIGITCLEIWLAKSAGNTSDPVYGMYETYFVPAYKTLLGPEGSQYVLWGIIAMVVYVTITSIKARNSAQKLPWFSDERLIITKGFVVKSILLACIFGVFWVKLIEMTDAEIVLGGPPLLTFGILTATTGFRNIHKSHGLMGKINVTILALFFQYVAFGYGLWYAIWIHALYDAAIFISEQLVQSLKNRMRQPTTQQAFAVLPDWKDF